MSIFEGAPFDRIMVLDFETVWDAKDYTLSKLTNEEYLRDARFHAWGASWKWYGEGRPQWVSHAALPDFFRGIAWSRTAVLAHNAQFDVSILSWIYGHLPVFIFDTLSMARAHRGVTGGNSLAQLAKDWGLPDKGQAVHSTNGITADMGLPPAVEASLAEYCNHDVLLCERVFNHLLSGLMPDGSYRGQYPVKELRLIDMTLKMYTQACLELDQEMLHKAIVDEREKRLGLLEKLEVDEKDLASNPKFAALLERLGVAPPMKTSRLTGQPTLALAKNDALFQAMLHGDNEDVASLCEARLLVKSTGERTRAQRFLGISRRGALPVPLSYFGAATGRWAASKGGAINMQNMKRGSFLRDAVLAPLGCQLVVGDLSQIEPRVLAWFADYTTLLDLFASGADVYATFGSTMFGIPGMTKETHPTLRQSAKSALLGAGYMLSWSTFAAQLLVGFLGAPPVRYDKAFAKAIGVTQLDVEAFMTDEKLMARMRAVPHTCTEAELLVHCVAAKAIIDKYRATAAPVRNLWRKLKGLIEHSLYEGNEVTFKCVTFRKEELVLPSGMSIRYTGLRKTENGWRYGEDSVLHEGRLTNNLVQGVARCVMTDGMLRVGRRYFVAGTVHDELISVVPNEEVKDAVPWVEAKMTKTPIYMPGIPLAAGVGAHERYGKAKE